MAMLLDTRGGNTKLAKTNRAAPFRYAGLSLLPTNEICPGAKAAGCLDTCLSEAGRGKFENVRSGRMAKTEYWLNERPEFLAQLRRELHNFVKTCARSGARPAVRLNVLSDIPWERHIDMPGEFAAIQFIDYTKTVYRLDKTPENYQLIFSYSGSPKFANQNSKAFRTNAPVAVVFRHGLPRVFKSRPVIDGDKDDIANAFTPGCVIGLRAKGPAMYPPAAGPDFVVNNPDVIGAVS